MNHGHKPACAAIASTAAVVAVLVVVVVIFLSPTLLFPHDQREVDFKGTTGTQVVRHHPVAALQVGKVQVCLRVFV